MNIFQQSNKIKEKYKNMKKGKITMTAIIGIMCLILTMLIYVQVKTISQTDISELETMRESELKTEITSLKTKYEEAAIEGKEASILLQKELKETEDLLGKNSVTGEGIIIKMSNTANTRINTEDLLELVNLLKNAGAEAISINEQRIVYDSYIADINEKNLITVKGEYIVPPYTIKAIGNTMYLESAVSQKSYGYIDVKLAEGKQITLERATNITIPQHERSLEFEYVREEE